MGKYHYAGVWQMLALALSLDLAVFVLVAMVCWFVGAFSREAYALGLLAAGALVIGAGSLGAGNALLPTRRSPFINEFSPRAFNPPLPVGDRVQSCGILSLLTLVGLVAMLAGGLLRILP